MDNPIVYNAVKRPHPATVAKRTSKALEDETVISETDFLAPPTPASIVPLNLEPKGPLIECWNEQHHSVVITRNTSITCLENGTLDLQHIVDAVPGSSQLHSIEISGALMLKGFTIPRTCNRLEHVTSFSITDTSLRIDDTALDQLAEVMPRLETLNLSGSRIDHIRGLQRMCANGLRRLLVKGCRITDVTSLNDVATQLHLGLWKGALQLEEVDIRDNSVEKVRIRGISAHRR